MKNAEWWCEDCNKLYRGEVVATLVHVRLVGDEIIIMPCPGGIIELGAERDRLQDEVNSLADRVIRIAEHWADAEQRVTDA